MTLSLRPATAGDIVALCGLDHLAVKDESRRRVIPKSTTPVMRKPPSTFNYLSAKTDK